MCNSCRDSDRDRESTLTKAPPDQVLNLISKLPKCNKKKNHNKTTVIK